MPNFNVYIVAQKKRDVLPRPNYTYLCCYLLLNAVKTRYSTIRHCVTIYFIYTYCEQVSYIILLIVL